MESVEAVVIGAGAAGLAAFQQLRAAGCDAVLIEARDRVGGRLWTLHPAGWPAPVELGAEFIHGAPPELDPFALADPAPRRHWRSGAGGLLPADGFGGLEPLFARMARIQPPAPDRSFSQFLAAIPDLPAPAREQALGYIEGYEAADPNRIGVHALNREWSAEADQEPSGPRRVRGGYAAWLNTLRADGDIRLESAVQAIRWRPGAVELDFTHPGGPATLRARQAIVTLPLSLLQQGSPRFDPPLAAKRGALAGLAMGGALRVILRLKSPVWNAIRDDAGDRMDQLGFLFGAFPASGHFAAWWTASVPGSEEAQIVGWAAGRHAWQLAGQPREALATRALADMAHLLRVSASDLAAQVLAVHTHDWQSDPFSLGAYSYAGVGGLDAAAALAAPLHHTLFFAGEATDDTGHHATVPGALRTGRRAAAQLLASGRC